MLTCNSISGGKTSAYLAVHYPADYNLFALVRTSDKNCLFPDKKLRQLVEDRIQKPFIGTLEMDQIIYTIFDLEQKLGKQITWVSGITFDEVVKTKGGWLPNKLHRYCTVEMKLTPMFYWWAENIGDPVQMRIGFRANETRRAKKMLERANSNGLLEMKATFEKHPSGRNKWEIVPWQKPAFPLIDDRIYRDAIDNYWQENTDVRFAQLNNCVGCFHRNPLLLRKMFEEHPNKMDWFKAQEGGKNGFWRSDVSYAKIEKHKIQNTIDFDDFDDCDTGYCGL